MAFASSHKKRCHASAPAGRVDDTSLFGEKRCRRICFEDLLRECYTGGNSTRLLWKILFEENEGGLGLWLQLEQNDPSAVLRMVSQRLQSARREESVKNQKQLEQKQQQQQQQKPKSQSQHQQVFSSENVPPPNARANIADINASSAPLFPQSDRAATRSNHPREPLSNSQRPFHFELTSSGFQF